MDKITFNKLSVQDQLKYVNNELSNGKSLRNISSDLKMSKTTIRDRLKKIGYVFNGEQRQYIKNICNSKEVEYKSNTSILHEDKTISNKSVKNNEYKNNTNILHKNKTIDNKAIAKHEYKENINILHDIDNKNKIIDILKKYDNLIEMMQWYNNQKNIVEPVELNIDSNRLVGKIKTTTVRLYSDVWDDFKKFMEQYPEFKNMDIVTMALLEFMDRYKK